MKVFVVLLDFNDGASQVSGVYSNERAAEIKAASLGGYDSRLGGAYVVEEEVLDQFEIR